MFPILGVSRVRFGGGKMQKMLWKVVLSRRGVIFGEPYLGFPRKISRLTTKVLSFLLLSRQKSLAPACQKLFCFSPPPPLPRNCEYTLFPRFFRLLSQKVRVKKCNPIFLAFYGETPQAGLMSFSVFSLRDAYTNHAAAMAARQKWEE